MQYNIQSFHGTPPKVSVVVRQRRDGAVREYKLAIKRVCKALKVDPDPLLLEQAEAAARDPKCRSHSTRITQGGRVHFVALT